MVDRNPAVGAFCRGQQRAKPKAANLLRRRGVSLLLECDEGPGCTLDLFEDGGEIWMVGCAHRLAVSGVRQRGATRRSRSRRRRERRLGKELKPASQRASNACQRIESTRHVNESTFSEAGNPWFPLLNKVGDGATSAERSVARHASNEHLFTTSLLRPSTALPYRGQSFVRGP